MDQNYRILTGDVSDQLANLPDNFFDAVLSDPPYGISFMGNEWDKGVPSAEVYGKLLRVLKPGAFGLHFGGTRMWHRLAANIEDAGFELRDTIMWLYGSGFPKSHNISKAIEAKVLTGKASMSAQRQAAMGADYEPTELAGTPGYGNTGARYTGTAGKGAELAISTDAAKQWDGYGTALKPAWEPALLVQKPLDKTFANNALAHGCGGLNIDWCRVGFVSEADRQESTAKNQHADFGTKPLTVNNAYGDWSMVQPKNYDPVGRFPANLILDEEAGEALGDAQRFFYCAKASTKERNAGCEAFEVKSVDHRSEVAAGLWAEVGVAPAKNNHPTLKPIALTTYLAKLLLVPKRADGQPRRILVPFSGAGSEMIGALKAGWDEVWGIEINPEYVAIAAARIAHHVPEAAPLACPDLGVAA